MNSIQLIDRIIKPRLPSFYAEQGMKRKYFYAIDTRGALFLEDSKHRNIATSMKDPQFLKHFYTMLRENLNKDTESSMYPLVSPCGKESNFVLPEDPLSVIGFQELTEINGQHTLLYGGRQFSETFNPKLLKFNPSTGRLYFPLSTSSRHLRARLGLVHPAITQQLPISASSSSSNSTGNSFVLLWDRQAFPIETTE